MLKTLPKLSALCVLGCALGTLVLTGSRASFAQEGAKPMAVCATVPDLGSLAREVGGDQVSVTVFAKGTEDAHFIEAKPSFIKTLSRCDLYIQTGMDLEIGWAPSLLQNARNAAVLPGGRGYLDASRVIERLEVPTGPVDRSMGDVHPLGNPHYLLDPLNGLKVARLIRDKLIELRPARKPYFDNRYAAFHLRLGAALVGETLARKYDADKLALLYEHGKLVLFLKGQGEVSLLGGWLGRMLPYVGIKVVADHNMWPYFARRFGITVIGFMEPKPGIPPTTKQLGMLVDLVRAERVGAILTVSYYDPRHARFISQQTGARIVNLAHQPGARDGTDDYLAMIDYNVRAIAAALGGS
ncbi:Manganese ABC transporter substrate-binding lipoprotein precursor [Candidatus Methylomirabilis lanthanidiphila]|uniref:Manganese ABC transporter substrate-binding lipoprotein n=1 Tax=Candidatus Methylomirabilis lanthanidiphila TaxID=2211376 RepID=A0A564ZH38_9BACT|nr:metal ABC transporter substrate-binding protein [Candidatus Methylomirabilis lanthanidiphila]VUZ84639.1 Manganese ABC transporter substrate-binding lipoprotein precursor [Candidatus Methylomirabilis lanthanidiphila]